MGEQSWRLVNNELMVRVSYMNAHQILHIFATFTHLYSFPTWSKCVGKAWLGGAALSGCRKQHQCCVRGWVSYIDIQKTGTSLPLPLTFLLFQWCSLRFQDQEVWVAGAAVILTAAVVPSWDLVTVQVVEMKARAGDGQENDGCSGSWNPVSRRWAEGRMKGWEWKDAGGLSS
jgi:hypothetical protein